jgi:UDP-N-acetylglucosamine 1-carboxyvinyltransferase
MSNAFQIRGGKPLSGEITPQGAKNEALQILCAVLLTGDEVRIKNIPDIKDVNQLIDILRDLGVIITKNGKGDYTFKADNINFDYIKSPEFKMNGAKLRGSVMLLGPL